ncbi:MAG: hypothetical protein AAB536_01120 [Patescibacteria group bacterium]
MNKKTRKSVFYGLCAVFVVAGVTAVLYAQGWRFDYETFGLKKVGGIYVRSFPDNAKIVLNGEFIDKKPGLLDRGRFIGNLFPKNYNLSLSEDGYLDWVEHVQVNSSLVSEIKYAVLIPKKSELVYVGTAKRFWADNDQIIIDSGKSLFLNGEKISGSDVLWQNSGSKTVLTKNAAAKTYFLNYFSGSTPTSTALNQKLSASGINPSNIYEITVDPALANNVILRTGTKIFSLNVVNREISQLISSSSTITKMAVSKSWIAWSSSDAKNEKSKVWFYERDSRSFRNAFELPGKTVGLGFRNDEGLGILQDDGGFYIGSSNGGLSAQAGQHEKTASDARNFVFSPDGSMAAVLENQAVEIFSLNSENNYWRFRLPENEKILRLEWYADKNHLFVIYPQETRFLDLNDKSLENFPVIASGNQAHYDPRQNIFYFIKDNELRKLAFPK